MTIEVRRVRPSDVAAVREVRLAALLDTPSAFASTHEREAAFTDDEWNFRTRRASAGPDSSTFLAWDGGAPVGIIGGFRFEPGAPVVDLVSMWTAPSHRRSGVGRLLVSAVVEWATDNGASAVELWVTRGNEPAQRLYESLGFAVTGEHQPLPSDPCKDEVRMRLALSTG